MYHGFFTGPPDWAGIYRVLVSQFVTGVAVLCGTTAVLCCSAAQAYKQYWNDDNPSQGTGCPVLNGPKQNCLAVALCNQYTVLSYEVSL